MHDSLDPDWQESELSPGFPVPQPDCPVRLGRVAPLAVPIRPDFGANSDGQRTTYPENVKSYRGLRDRVASDSKADTKTYVVAEGATALLGSEKMQSGTPNRIRSVT